jgi:hypothetical protein
VAVAEPDDLRQFLFREVVGPQAGIEAGKTEKNRIRPVGNGSLETIPSPGRGEKFGFHEMVGGSIQGSSWCRRNLHQPRSTYGD